MKKLLFSVATALMMGLAVTSCGSKDRADKMLDDMEKIVEKMEKIQASGDEAKAFEVLGDLAKLGEEYKDLNEEDFTAAQKKRAEELTKRMDAVK